MAIPRGKPYVWATWLSRVMTGNVSCQWQYWFLARHKLIEEQPATFDSVGWQIRHTRLLTEVRQELMAAGLRLNTEFAFQCRVLGCDVLINGKIDCLAVDGRIVTVYDCKTGIPRESHQVQVMIYMYALSTYPRFMKKRIQGIVVYQQRRIDIPCLPEDFADQIAYFTRLLAAGAPGQGAGPRLPVLQDHQRRLHGPAGHRG
ncbi:MAG TPA: PD-(D/E)XK nuclease family protein [Nitrolancea sp.]|nr:PD-(D/E)XK nuclease family protein [Nitrolancea sp.]